MLRYHQPRQFAWRLIRIVQRRVRSAIPERMVFRSGGRLASWKPAARDNFLKLARRRTLLWPGRARHVADMAEGRFCFLGRFRDLAERGPEDLSRMQWRAEMPRLWQFHLHCQEYLLDLAEIAGADSAWQVVASWLNQPAHRFPTRDPDAWHPFCISRRLPVWLGLAARCEPPPAISESFWRSVADQVVWLQRNRERDLGGNHLLENLTALYLAACYLQVPGQASMPQIESHLLRQIELQTLPSGEHCERAATYHLLMLVCVLECLQAARFASSQNTERLAECAHRMLAFGKGIRNKDGTFPLLADSVDDETPDFEKLLSWADDLGVPDPAADPGSDYWVSDFGEGSRLLFDCGALACDHLPAHGHADLTQITACIDGYQAIVDTGTFQYEPGPPRLHCRQTGAHNVLQVGGLEQCDVWSSFRMGRRGHVLWHQRGRLDTIQWAAAAHDGFSCPTGRVVLAVDRTWTVLDWFGDSPGEVKATSRLHWHPDWSVEIAGDQGVVAKHPDRSATVHIRAVCDEHSIFLRAGQYYPNFGEARENVCVEFSRSGIGGGQLGYTIVPGARETPNWSVARIGRVIEVALGGRVVVRLDTVAGILK